MLSIVGNTATGSCDLAVNKHKALTISATGISNGLSVDSNQVLTLSSATNSINGSMPFSMFTNLSREIYTYGTLNGSTVNVPVDFNTYSNYLFADVDMRIYISPNSVDKPQIYINAIEATHSYRLANGTTGSGVTAFVAYNMESLVVCCAAMKWRRALNPDSLDTASIRNTFFGESSYCYASSGQAYYTYSGYTSGWQSYFILKNDSATPFTCEYRIRYYL